MIGENTHPMPITIMMQEIGLVKKVAALPVYWNAFNMLLSRVGPRMKARISGAVGMPAYAMKIPTTANASIMPHLYRLPESTYALTMEMISSAGYM